jgi:hypothetical protein
MTRRAVRIAWVATGVCLAIGMLASLFMWLGPPDRPWQQVLRELSSLVDVAAFLFWLAIFAIYWKRRARRD